MASGTLLSIGHGYSAAALAARLVPQGWQVLGTTRQPERMEAMRATGVHPLRWPLTDPAGTLRQATHLLTSAPPEAGSDPVLDALGTVLTSAGTSLRWIGYLSTTGVYGDHKGGWVDEDTQPAPGNARSRARLAAEQRWLALGRVADIPVHIFRIGGIYGPGRAPFAAIREGKARSVVKPGQVFGRIHVEDIARVLEASMQAPNPGRVYNVVDDEPAPGEEVRAHAAALLGLPPPPTVSYEEEAPRMSEMAKSFYAESRKVRNTRIRQELGVDLAYPSYREGLAAILAAEQG
jgi:nucleoside-diphosphate-sugar epimerase